MIPIRRCHNDFPRTLAFSPDGKTLAIATHEGEPPDKYAWVVEQWDVSTARQATHVQLSRKAWVTVMALSSNLCCVVGGDKQGRVILWSLRNSLVAESQSRHKKLFALAFSNDCRVFAAAGDNDEVTLYRTFKK